MEVLSVKDKQASKITTFPYKGKVLEVKGVWIKWLSQAGPEDSPDYGLRFFTVAPGGEIPIHNHFYVQTMYILKGQLSVASYDGENDEVTEERMVGPDDVIFIPSMEPHSLKNTSNSREAAFLCCIANVYDKDF